MKHFREPVFGEKAPRPRKPILTTLLFMLMLTAVSLTGGLLYLRAQALPAAFIPQTSVIFDTHGEIIDTMYKGQNRHVVALDDISPYLVKATLAIEDHRFFQHAGIDFRGIARAAMTDLKSMDKVEGASTITQQLARNLYLSQERTWTRKIKEALYSLQLEMEYSKEEILTKYLNQIYYGHAAYGIEAAANLYFGKHAKDLTLAESALLAGVPKGPKYYSPYLNLQNAKARQKTVLATMVRYHYISQEDADKALAEELRFQPLKDGHPSRAPYFRDYIRREAVEQLGISEQMFDEGGIRIYTTLDLRMQEAAEAAVANHIDKTGDLEVALIAIDPRTGAIKAMVGGKDYEQNQYNRVFATTRQPGSSFKAILYLAALEEGAITPATMFKSEPTAFAYDDGRKMYMPSNFDDQYPYKDIGLREAISHSDNIYAVHTIMQIGPERVIDMARKLGITSPLKPLPSLALGAFPVSPFEMASAFAVIANQGLFVKPQAIQKIVDGKGHVLYEAKKRQERVVDAAHAYVLTNLLESVFAPGGTGARVSSMLNRPVAGKTGTTDTDAWMVGFTPELVTAVWVGHDQGKK
ncbi:MAG TPA: PBP1A family penicillin-binding protein, partial [Bacilli bacterium]